MNPLPLARAAAFMLIMGGPALAADMSPQPMPFAQRFNWTSCYLGGHVGGGLARTAMTDPVQVVQDNIPGATATTGITTTSANPNGVVVGAQFGCDYQFASSWVVGIEGAISGSTMKGSTTAPLRDNSPDTALVTTRNDFLGGVTGRLGYAMDHVLLYAKGGFAFAGDKYDITGGGAAVVPFSFDGVDRRIGWTAGGGAEWVFSRHWSAILEYDYYQFGTKNVLMNDLGNVVSGTMDVRQSVQVVKTGLNFHMWASDN
jgi:outer membrane immunogenic protein